MKNKKLGLFLLVSSAVFAFSVIAFLGEYFIIGSILLKRNT